MERKLRVKTRVGLETGALCMNGRGGTGRSFIRQPLIFTTFAEILTRDFPDQVNLLRQLLTSESGSPSPLQTLIRGGQSTLLHEAPKSFR